MQHCGPLDGALRDLRAPAAPEEDACVLNWASQHERRARQVNVAVGSSAPSFSLPSTEEADLSLADLVAQGPVVLAFYPKDNTSG